MATFFEKLFRRKPSSRRRSHEPEHGTNNGEVHDIWHIEMPKTETIVEDDAGDETTRLVDSASDSKGDAASEDDDSIEQNVTDEGIGATQAEMADSPESIFSIDESSDDGSHSILSSPLETAEVWEKTEIVGIVHDACLPRIDRERPDHIERVHPEYSMVDIEDDTNLRDLLTNESPTAEILEIDGIHTLGDLLACSESYLLSIADFDARALYEVKHLLNRIGLRLYDGYGPLPPNRCGRDSSSPTPVRNGNPEEYQNSVRPVFDRDPIARLPLSRWAKEEIHRRGIDTVEQLVYALGNPYLLVGLRREPIAEAITILDRLSANRDVSIASSMSQLERSRYGDSGYGFNAFGILVKFSGLGQSIQDDLLRIGDRYGVPIGSISGLTRGSSAALRRAGIKNLGELRKTTDDRLLRIRKFREQGLVDVHQVLRNLERVETSDPISILEISAGEPQSLEDSPAMERLSEAFSSEAFSLAEGLLSRFTDMGIDVNEFAFYCTILPMIAESDDSEITSKSEGIFDVLVSAYDCTERAAFILEQTLIMHPVLSINYHLPEGDLWDRAATLLAQYHPDKFAYNGELRNVYLIYPTVEEWLDNLPDTERNIVTSRLNGLTYNDLADKYELSRDEAIDCVAGILSNRPALREDVLSEIYAKYDWQPDEFQNALGIGPLATDYLNMTTSRHLRRGKRMPLKEILKDEAIEPVVKERISKALHRLEDYGSVDIDGRKIAIDKMSIIDHLMSARSVDGWMHEDVLWSLYQGVIKNNGMDDNDSLHFKDRRAFAAFVDMNDPNILSVPYPRNHMPKHGNLRWFPVEDVDFWPLVNALEELTALNRACSCKVFFDNRIGERTFKSMMPKYNAVRDEIESLGIKDEYMLHRILLRYTPWMVGIELGPTPVIVLGEEAQ